jgi:hypothetical protein
MLAAGGQVSDIIGLDKQFKDYKEFFEFLKFYSKSTNNKLVIYANTLALQNLLSNWFKSILPNANSQDITALLKSLAFRLNVFYKGRFRSDNNTDEVNVFDLNYDESAVASDLSNLANSVGVEFLLASYLYNGTYKEELKSSIQPLIRKDLQKYLYELKEIFFVHLMTKRFTKDLKFNKDYDFYNFTNVIYDDSKFTELFMNERIWGYPYMAYPADTRLEIRLENITQKDIELFKEFTVFAGAAWCEEGCYIFIKSDINKLDFLSVLSNFTDESLDKLIDAESTFENSAGSFFSIDLESVNHYQITALLEAHKTNNKDFLKSYALNG